MKDSIIFLRELLQVNTKMPISKNIKQIFDTLSQNGYEAYLVGGCVRDFLLGKEPHDYDITTNATPEQVKFLFAKTIDTGIKHGTVTVCLGDEQYEITTFRKDGDYSDGRHPDKVEFTSSIEEDLSRRDFTINSIAFSPEKGFVDPFNGRYDLERKVIQCVGNPADRFSEDALRLLRAIRFSAQLFFNIDYNTWIPITLGAHLTKAISRERIQEEFNKTLLGKGGFRFSDFVKFGYISPCIDEEYRIPQDKWIKFKDLTYANLFMEYEDRLPKDPIERIQFLYSYMLANPYNEKGLTNDLETVKKYFEYYKYSNEIKDTVVDVCKLYHKLHNFDEEYSKSSSCAKQILCNYTERVIDIFIQLCLVRCADKKELDKNSENVWSSIVKIKRCKEPYLLKDLAINGNDLIKLGYSGKEIGEVLSELQKAVWKDKELNTKEKLMKFLNNNVLCSECNRLVPKEYYDEDMKMCDMCFQRYQEMQEQDENERKYYEENYDFERGDWRY